ncbi:hypothetical protein IQ260_12125 [Leptolyngbya cf. ectocarpi LEGE 11479]|uniref:Uncharacterized protein n=1 Tax=Leptolyngbya cf. ectocarpi LEGE 11479 TaxID=1828722 RepID=A0A929F9G9_LEPEC|nr:hypothetical protein [Leptolyngbya ectocarpi]MBE9067403.1 hypothetical protein [Leptolyngbya cf. ectocarpi LEGE 11479]
MDANRRPAQATSQSNRKPISKEEKTNPQENLATYTSEVKHRYNELNQKMYAELENKLSGWFEEFQQVVEGHKRHPWKWLTGLILIIFLGLNGFLYYKQAQQIQQLNNLVEQLTPAEPSDGEN